MSEFNYVVTDPQQIYDSVIGGLTNGTGEDLYPGDERRIFGEALVPVLVSLYTTLNDAARQTLLANARGETLDAIGVRVGVKRLEAQKATVSLEITAPESGENIIIPQHTKVGAGDLYFLTDKTVVITAGETSVIVTASSEEGGSKYNGIPPGAIKTLVDLIPGVSGVISLTETKDGDDGEPYELYGDDHLRERIRLAPDTFSVAGPEGAYRYYATSADPDIISVGVESPEPTQIILYPLMRGGMLPSDDVLAKVVQVCNDIKVRPMTDLVTAQAPETVPYSIEVKYYTPPDTESAVISAVEGDGGAIDDYIAWQSGGIARAINPDELRKRILNAGAIRVDLTAPEYEEVEGQRIAQFSDELTVSHEVVIT
jgi:phage-related baseplate assembly protein